jgi:ABC-type Mn2+/Zn2+ transport system permease subunit
VRFGSLVAWAVGISVGSSVIGLYLSFWLDVASGATIVLAQSAVFLIALVVGPRRGVIAPRAPAHHVPATEVPE